MSTRADADAALAAEQVQAYAYGWLVWWSLRYRRFEAWDCRDAACFRTVHADSAAELWDRMQQVELDLWRTSSPGATWTTWCGSRPGSPNGSVSTMPSR
ncbi:hypothetical protein OG884_09195 [Streptosporangium sp. NBC_01755]|uniref:hypothetical protein n=1 Tax=unclassified Streptosporangium TaxID=2632669 RepID=UPI002DD8B54B|nr:MULTISPECIES: hypothetical protein [unclassified Streptosporangium]WSA26510.1 hypothetical protein OIE13_00955 [Streptosporangium sp. NBC_01810]WSD02067.1 hypothetical protein OG884_09195 [Streptosporangium sp. NBC_01755]